MIEMARGCQKHLEAPMSGPIYALNLFNVADRDEYLAYSRRSAKEVQAHGDDPRRMGVEGCLRQLLQRSKNSRPASAPRKRRPRLHLAPLRQTRGPAAHP